MIKVLFLLLLSIPTIAYSQYSVEQIQGIWQMDINLKYPEEAWCDWGNQYRIFKGNKYMYVDVLSDYKDPLSVYVCYFGFSEEYGGDVSVAGKYFNTSDDSITYASALIDLTEGENLFLYSGEYSFLKNLPKKAQIVLYKRSLYDHRNYAREFLDYDICGIKTEGCQLLDSLQQPIGVAIAKDDIVVVRETSGDFLKVEYEDVEHFIYGYVKREDLVFVEE